jgi:hypothetical protein
MDTTVAYKVTRANGRDFYSDSVEYAVGKAVTQQDCDPPETGPCGRGLHVAPTPRGTIRFGNRSIDRGRWRWFEVRYRASDLLAQDEEKHRVRSLEVVRELTIVDVLGADLGERVKDVNERARSWKSIAWLKPEREVTEEDVRERLSRWRVALEPWAAKRGVTIAPTEARKYAAYAAAAAAAYTYAADAADRRRAASWRPSWLWWYVRPYYVLWREARAHLAGITPNPWTPFVELYQMGCLPIGYRWADGEPVFIVYAPKAAARAKAA